MSGHNKWSKIKHQKGADDIKKGNLYTKLTREIIISTREGGSDPDGNFRLRIAITKARDSNMPLDNIDRAIKKGSGSGEGGALIEMVMEGYGPGGTAILVNALSDNRNRTVQEIRSTFTRHGGSLAESGSVSWLFESKGIISIDAANVNADDVALQAIDAGAEDVQVQSGSVEIYTAPENLMKVRQALEKAKFTVASGELVKEPKTMVTLDEKAAMQALKLIDKLEQLDDVQNVYSNADIPEAVMNSYESAAA
jgi:YebC/PmpR family DNA-binding regulatory protein